LRENELNVRAQAQQAGPVMVYDAAHPEVGSHPIVTFALYTSFPVIFSGCVF
jgi:hypothetical protein